MSSSNPANHRDFFNKRPWEDFLNFEDDLKRLNDEHHPQDWNYPFGERPERKRPASNAAHGYGEGYGVDSMGSSFDGCSNSGSKVLGKDSAPHCLYPPAPIEPPLSSPYTYGSRGGVTSQSAGSSAQSADTLALQIQAPGSRVESPDHLSGDVSKPFVELESKSSSQTTASPASDLTQSSSQPTPYSSAEYDEALKAVDAAAKTYISRDKISENIPFQLSDGIPEFLNTSKQDYPHVFDKLANMEVFTWKLHVVNKSVDKCVGDTGKKVGMALRIWSISSKYYNGIVDPQQRLEEAIKHLIRCTNGDQKQTQRASSIFAGLNFINVEYQKIQDNPSIASTSTSSNLTSAKSSYVHSDTVLEKSVTSEFCQWLKNIKVQNNVEDKTSYLIPIDTNTSLRISSAVFDTEQRRGSALYEFDVQDVLEECKKGYQAEWTALDTSEKITSILKFAQQTQLKSDVYKEEMNTFIRICLRKYFLEKDTREGEEHLNPEHPIEAALRHFMCSSKGHQNQAKYMRKVFGYLNTVCHAYQKNSGNGQVVSSQ